MFVVFFLFLSLKEVCCAYAHRNNVCKTLSAYANIQRSKLCYYNPDVDSTPYQIANRYGFIIENHIVTTKDGYILTLFRLLDKKGKSSQNRQPVAVQHGIMFDGVSWMLSGAFHLARAELDVWIINSRGTYYSLAHTNTSISDKDYWNFSFHEVGIYDLPAIIEEISNQTNRTDIVHIGHSLGATSSTIYSSLLNDHAKKYIKGLIHLAPVIKFYKLRGLIAFATNFYDVVMGFIDFFGLHALGQYTTIQKFLFSISCSKFPLIIPCQMVEFLLAGLAVEQVRPEIFPLVLTNFPAGTSIKTVLHFYQIISKKGRFQMYDYGFSTNLKLYNSTDPPEYNIEKITLPIHIIRGKQDFLSTEEDVNNFYNQLKCPKSLEAYDAAHNDFAFGKKMDEIYRSITNVIKKFDESENEA